MVSSASANEFPEDSQGDTEISASYHLLNVSAACIPQEDAAPQGHSNLFKCRNSQLLQHFPCRHFRIGAFTLDAEYYQVGAAPVKEVEVIVIEQVRSVKNAFRRLRYGTERLLDGPGSSVLRVEGDQGVLVSLWRCWSLPVQRSICMSALVRSPLKISIQVNLPTEAFKFSGRRVTLTDLGLKGQDA